MKGNRDPSQDLPQHREAAATTGKLVLGWWHPCPKNSQGQQLLRKCLSAPSLGYVQIAELGKLASPQVPFHGEQSSSGSRDSKPLYKMWCAVRPGAQVFTLSLEQPEGRGQELSWVVCQRSAEPGILWKVCLQRLGRTAGICELLCDSVGPVSQAHKHLL